MVRNLKAVSHSTSQGRFVRCIKGSNQLASRSANLNFIAQELALQMAAHDFEYKLLQHIPGIIANAVPDALARQFAMPPKAFPSSCAMAVIRSVPERTASF
jgi:hypothetical protein